MAPYAVLLSAVALLLAAPANGPGLKVVARDPLTIYGYGFGTLEKVRLDVRSGQKRTVRTVRTGKRGTFTSAFVGFRLDGRTDLSVTATGARGDRASFTVRHVVSGGAATS